MPPVFELKVNFAEIGSQGIFPAGYLRLYIIFKRFNCKKLLKI